MKQLIILFILISNFLFSKDLLWKIERGNSTVYLTGSIHMGTQDMYPLPESLENAFDASQNLVLEINMDTMNAKAMYMMQKMMLPKGETLKSKLNDTTYNKLIAELKSVGFPPNMAKMYKPWAAALTYTQLKIMAMGLSPDAGIDQYFFKKAKDSSKKVISLETVEMQLELFDSFDEYANEFVEQTLNSMSDQSKIINDMVDAWKVADLEKLDILINEEANTEAEKMMNKKLLDERNLKMLEKIDGMLNTDETYFVVVGAGHLSGKMGLVQLFKDKGYKIEQI